ncbi:MAG: hypothetical protein DSM106950_26715 [Stigonema ocellatum SAG 48.90 = DSM 106950]|nr:hypothetical protein [Stigonema ocellatum SAG 48.90 = DSM 106950]
MAIFFAFHVKDSTKTVSLYLLSLMPSTYQQENHRSDVRTVLAGTGAKNPPASRSPQRIYLIGDKQQKSLSKLYFHSWWLYLMLQEIERLRELARKSWN